MEIVSRSTEFTHPSQKNLPSGGQPRLRSDNKKPSLPSGARTNHHKRKPQGDSPQELNCLSGAVRTTSVELLRKSGFRALPQMVRFSTLSPRSDEVRLTPVPAVPNRHLVIQNPVKPFARSVFGTSPDLAIALHASSQDVAKALHFATAGRGNRVGSLLEVSASATDGPNEFPETQASTLSRPQEFEVRERI